MSNYISPYISGEELLARLGRGDANGALKMLRTLWGHMVDTDPNSTMWEKVGFDGDVANYAPNQIGLGTTPDTIPFAGRGMTSMAQGWSAGGPVRALSGGIAGITLTSPGFRTWSIAPQTGNLHWAQATVPTPQGPIAARWRRGKDWFKLTTVAPRGTSGTVTLPRLGRTVARDGKIVHGLSFSGVRGRHTWVVTP